MSEMVERVIASRRDLVTSERIDRRGARGHYVMTRDQLEENSGRDWVAGPFATHRDAEKEIERLHARAAIEVMREPIRAMFNAGLAPQADYADGVAPPDEVWRAMIDEALSVPSPSEERR